MALFAAGFAALVPVSAAAEVNAAETSALPVRRARSRFDGAVADVAARAARDFGRSADGGGAATTGTSEERRRDWAAEMEFRKSYVIPAAEIVGFDVC